MRKRIISPGQNEPPFPDNEWLPLEKIALVEVTSEDPAHPVESALLPGASGGWRAATPGAQVLRLHFDTPQRLQHIRLHFVDAETERTQEFTLRYSQDNGRTFHEIVRQQWNFSPNGSTREVETYQVELAGVTALELAITPDLSNGNAYASLAEFRCA